MAPSGTRRLSDVLHAALALRASQGCGRSAAMLLLHKRIARSWLRFARQQRFDGDADFRLTTENRALLAIEYMLPCGLVSGIG